MTETIPATDIPTFEIEEVVPTEEDLVTEIKKSITPRTCVKFVARTSVKFVVAGIVTSLVPEPETKIEKIKVAVGTYVIAGAVAKNTESFVEDKFDEWKKNIQELRAAVKDIETVMSKTHSSIDSQD